MSLRKGVRKVVELCLIGFFGFLILVVGGAVLAWEWIYYETPEEIEKRKKEEYNEGFY